MKTFALFAIAALAGITLSPVLHSQFAQLQTPVQQLQGMKAKNQQIIEKQTATLQKLDEIELQAQQVKFLGKRS